MIIAVADTHAAIWSLTNDPRLSVTVQSLLARLPGMTDQVGLATVSLIETIYLEEKRRIPAGTFTRMLEFLDRPGSSLVEVPLNRDIALSLARIDRAAVPDMPDRIIAATALFLGVPVISRDRRIRASNVATIW